MRKYVIAILILIIVILAGFVILAKPKSNENTTQPEGKTNIANNTNVTEEQTKIPEFPEEEKNRVKEYIQKIYSNSEITGTTLPEFTNINDADETWIWEVVKNGLMKNNDDVFEFTYSQITEEAKKIFGSDFTVEFPEEGIGFLKRQDDGKYVMLGMGLDDYNEQFVIKNITKSNNVYTVTIEQYILDYYNSHQAFDEYMGEEDVVYDIYLVYEAGGEILETYRSDVEQEKIEKYVLEHSSQFPKLTLEIELDETTNLLHVISITR